MSNIISSLNQRCLLIPKIDLTNDSHVELMLHIFEKHGEKNITKVKLIDENDEYDSFLVETEANSFIVKTSLDPTVIFYEFVILKGIENLHVSPMAIDRGEVSFGETLYYTIQTYEFSDNLNETGGSLVLDDNHFSNFNMALNIMHKFIPPEEVHDFFDNDQTYLEYHKINFNNLTQYVDNSERWIFNFLEEIYNESFEEMMTVFHVSKSSLTQKTLVHGNLDLSTIITNSTLFKFINFENAFIGNQFFDLANIVFELQTTGINEFDFISKRLKLVGLTENRFAARELLQEYKVCKYIWTRKRFLDILKDYLNQVIIFNKTKTDKLQKLGNEFAKHFYRFDDINCFRKNKDMFVKEFQQLILSK